MTGDSEKVLFVSESPEETAEIAKRIFKELPEAATLCFFGEMGTGKTCFIKALAEAAGIPAEKVTSPTFTYLNIYSGTIPFYHFDLWRLSGEEAFLNQGFDEYLSREGITCIEWSEKIPSLLPLDAIKVYINATSEMTREITIEKIK